MPNDAKANELKITKCTARPTAVIVYFSAPLVAAGGADPNLPATYTVWELRPAGSEQTPAPLVAAAAVTITNVVYDTIIRQAAVLEFVPRQQPGQMLLVEVDSEARSKGGPISPTGRQYTVQVDGKDAAEAAADAAAKAKVEAAAKAAAEAVAKAKAAIAAAAEKAKENDEELKKILQPPYAMGMNLITRDDYNTLKNEYFSQSELSLGLILPMVLIVLGLVLTPQLGLAPPGWPTGRDWHELQFWLRGLAWIFMCLAMVRISEAMFLIGMERYHKFRLEVKLLILGNWQKQQDAKKTKGSGSSGSKPSKPTPPAAGTGASLSLNLSPVTLDIRTKHSEPPASSDSASDTDKSGEKEVPNREKIDLNDLNLRGFMPGEEPTGSNT